MIESKHMIIVGVIICALMAYYFYSELTKMKKIVDPIHHKSLTMKLRLGELEKKINTNVSKRKINTHSPPLSITYNSSDIGRNQLSVIYDENIRESEANRLLKNIENKNKRQTVAQNMHSCPAKEYNDLLVDLSESDKQSLKQQIDAAKQDDLFGGDTARSASNSGYDSDIMRYVSESLYYADLPSDGSQLSDIPKPLKRSGLGSNVMSKITLKHKNELKK